MGIKEFIKKVKSTLGLSEYEVKNKKKSLKDLLVKLNDRKKSINKLLEVPMNKKDKKNLEEELKIVSCQINKGKKILDK